MSAYDQGWRLIPAGQTLPGETISPTSEEAARKRGNVWFNVQTGATTTIDPDAPVGQGTVSGSIQAGAPTDELPGGGGGNWPGGSQIDPSTGLPWGQSGGNTPDPYASLIGGGTNVAVANPISAMWETDPFAAYMQQQGIEGTGRNPYQKWQLSQYAPTRASYLAQEALNPSPTNTPYFGNYMQNTGIAGARAAAPGLFQQITNLPWEAQESARSNIGDYFDNLMANVFGARYGRQAGRQMAGDIPTYQAAYTGAGGGYETTTDTFLNYLRRKYGL